MVLNWGEMVLNGAKLGLIGAFFCRIVNLSSVASVWAALVFLKESKRSRSPLRVTTLFKATASTYIVIT